MIFACDGKRYDTSEMDAYETGKAFQPAYYISRDRKAVFVQTMTRATGVGVHRASESEIEVLWNSHRVPELLRVLAGLGDGSVTGEIRGTGGWVSGQKTEAT